MNSILSKDFEVLHGNGLIGNRDDLLREFLRWTLRDYKRDVVDVRQHGEVVFVTSHTLKVEPQDNPVTTLEVFIKEAGKWKLALIQNTPVLANP